MAVTKNRTREEAMAAVAAGVTLLGENRVQEAKAKWVEPPDSATLHLIGHLQTNKVKYAIKIFNTIQSIDSEHLASAINQRVHKPFSVMVEVNAGKDPTKTGMFIEDVLPFIASAHQWPNLRIDGILALLPRAEDSSSQESQRIRRLMQEIVKLWRMCRQEGFPWAPLEELSMGMTEDWEWAVEEGTTMIRLGTALFGPRPYPQPKAT